MNHFQRLLFAAKLSLIVLLAASCASTESPTVQPMQPVDSFTVMSFNIRSSAGPEGLPSMGERLKNLTKIAEFLQKVDPDIILLQEVDRQVSRSGFADQAGFIAETMGYDHVFAPAIPLQEGEYGVATLSRWTIAESEVTKLFKPDYSVTNPDYPEWYSEQRVLLHTEIIAPFGNLSIYNTHLGLTEDQRAQQVNDITSKMNLESGNIPVVFGGDLNIDASTPELSVLKFGLEDTLEYKSSDGLGSAFMTFPATQPERRIDYLFYTPDKRPAIECINHEVIRVQLSDHLPVMATFDLN